MKPVRLQTLSIKTKLIVLVLCLLCAPFLVLGILWYEQATKTIRDNAEQANIQLVERLSSQLDSYFSDVENVTFPLVTHPLIIQFMKTDPSDQYGMFEISGKIEKELLPNMVNSRPDLYGFSIITKNGAVTSYGNYGARERNVGYLMNATGTETFKVAGINKLSGNNAITVLRYFRDAQTYQTMGLLAVDLKLNKISSMLSRIKLGETGKVWLMDAEGRIVYDPDWSTLGRPAPAFYLQTADRQAVYRKVDGVNKLIYMQKSERTGWTMISEVPLNELNGRLNRLRNTTIWIGSGLVLFVLLVISAFSFNLTLSLSNLQRLMKKAENGDLTVHAPERRLDEIGMLNRSFNKMVAELRRLIEFVHTSELREKEMQIRQRESSLQAMQSQINPHFLYNTLEVINSYAILEGVTPISRMASSLADIFRYSVGDARQVVTLAEEMHHITTYFSIQSERFRHLAIDLDVDPETAERVLGVRLMLQPLVENAFIHAYEKHKQRPDYIGIKGIPLADGYLVQISDKGGGMEPELIERYNRLFLENAKEEPEEPASSRKRIGLMNVHERLRLTFGEPYGLHILRTEGPGTLIEIRLPYDKTD
ncbi:histidine kinase [Paenibacillus sp. CC-CFT747]|nr:histidine kinase [Paenibacillus sp. CC-CFT747]